MNPYIGLTERAMDISAFQRNVISNNVANYNTPDFKAVDVRFDEFFKNEEMSMKKTNEKHLSFDNDEKAVYVEKDTKMRFDGNNVDLNKEMTEMIRNNYRFNNAVRAFNKEVNMMRTVLGK